MTYDFRPIEQELKAIKQTVDNLDNRAYKDPEWQKLSGKIAHIRRQEDEIDIDLFNHYFDRTKRKLPQKIDYEVYQRNWQMITKIKALLLDYKQVHSQI